MCKEVDGEDDCETAELLDDADEGNTFFCGVVLVDVFRN